MKCSLSLWICPICAKQNSIKHYDPTDFVNDILIIRKRGLGRGMGFEVVEEYSLLDGSDPELLNLISDRIAAVYELLYEDVEDDDDEEEESVGHEDEIDYESLSELDKAVLLLVQDEDEAEGEDDEEEDINDLDEEISE